MSEYQHYAFAAIDRPLTADEVATLRALEKRATLNPTRFVAEYHSGDLDARPEDLLLQHFDVHTYVSSWGTAELVLRLPQEALVRDVVKPFLVAERVEVRQKLDTLILTLHREAGDDPKAHEEAAGWLDALVPLRQDLLDGDLRLLYLGWLAAAQAGHVDGDVVEPLVPAGLAEQTPALAALARLFRLDPDLVAAAAEQAPARRPAQALLAAGQARAEARRQQADGAASAARNKVLDALKAREEQAWAEAEETIGMPGGGPVKTAAFKAKAKLLQDLRELADRDGTRDAFDVRLAALREQKKVPGFWLFYDPPRVSKAFG